MRCFLQSWWLPGLPFLAGLSAEEGLPATLLLRAWRCRQGASRPHVGGVRAADESGSLSWNQVGLWGHC